MRDTSDLSLPSHKPQTQLPKFPDSRLTEKKQLGLVTACQECFCLKECLPLLAGTHQPQAPPFTCIL